MKKLFTFFLSTILCSSVALAQYEIDYGLQLGGALHVGDIGGKGEPKGFLLDMNISQANMAVGAFFRYSFSSNIAIKFNAGFVRIQGADSLSVNAPTRLARNLSFRTDILEASLVGEYTFLQKNDFSRRSRQRIDFKSRVFAGAGAIYFDPKAQLNGTWYSLRPLQTEGIAYDEISIIVPMGMAFDFTFNKKLRVGMEFGYRFTFTDYLDDVSTRYPKQEDLLTPQAVALSNRSDEAFARGIPDLPNRGFYTSGSRRGNPDNNDGYFITQITLSYVIKSGNDFYKPRYNSLINRKRKRTKF
tara:strand:- start:233 stop:1135 length:903 start_codon:yes stop_codon:yes gene_type:complete